MAKLPKASDTEGEITFTMVKFGMKGSDASLQKGLESIKAAFVQAGFIAVQETRQLRSNGAAQLEQVGSSEPEVAVEIVDAEQDEVATEAPAHRKPSAPKKATNYKIIKDLVIDDVKPTLAEFCGEKNPKTDLDRYKCIAYWFKHHKDTPDLTVEHFFTVYMMLDWKLPKNPLNPASDLRKQQVFLAGTERATSTISNLGEKQVREMVAKES